MKKVGVIMEVNPFHNGHKYFLEQVRKLEKEAYIVCLVTTTLTQRGEISVLPKNVKTELLLEHGVDLVIELPSIFTNQGGEYYGYHNVNILNQLGVKKIIFGSESKDLKKIQNQNNLNTTQVEKSFREGYIKNKIGNLKSNDILAMSYLKAITQINPNIEYEAIKRYNNDYNDSDLIYRTNAKICSATAIRNNLHKKEVKEYLPQKSYENIIDLNDKKLVELLVFNLLVRENNDIFLSEQGQLVSKIKRVFKDREVFENAMNYSYSELCIFCSDKNNSKYKISRIFLNIIFQVREKDVDFYTKNLNKYKVLGFSNRYSKQLKKEENLFFSYKEVEDSSAYMINDKIDKVLNLYINIDYKLNYMKPIIY